MMMDTLVRSSATTDDFIRAGLNNSAISDNVASGLRKFADKIIACREDISQQNELSKLQNVVLPTLTEFELALDARVKIADGAVQYVTPTVVSYIDTDSEDQVIWFQMNEQRTKELRDKLTDMLEEIKILNEWTDRSSKHKC